ncbi:hypothetical protein [Rhizosphaericola mali]|uniref:Uncharacterized protein n=1 Tax=Rhizosphaericola mali TaxID=2545455 RepID=A0A5P2G6E1_9BACT|nr:hypothetical protein [Rhizosphaericola mali]QES89512.1 hypothetical protein E0W69_012855 [Rhizosphaericola mali]
MRKWILLLLLCCISGVGWGQEKDNLDKSLFSIGFKNDTIYAEKSSKEEYITIPLKVNIGDPKDWRGYNLKVEIDPTNTSMSPMDYKLLASNFDFTALNDDKIINILLKIDTIEDRNRYIVVNLKTLKDEKIDVEKRNISSNKKVVILVKTKQKNTENQIINDYNFLSYMGTNFDIVEGKTKPKNLFFAMNIFIPPVTKKNKVGFYFSLYGNRTMSDIDSTGNVRRTYKLESIDEASHTRYTSQNKMITNRVSDNVGAYISPVFKIIESSNKNLNLYYSPSLEFIWRKSSTITQFEDPTNLEKDTINTPISGTIVMDDLTQSVQNEYVFNLGVAGILLVYETNSFSFRVQSSVGYSSYFYPSNSLTFNGQTKVGRTNDIFFSGRSWITEASTGLTLQAEIMNTSRNPRPFFGITLSKAFKLNELGSIFKPITSR